MDKVKILKLAKWLKLTKEIKTDEGVVLLIAGDIAVGEEVFVADESGNMIPAPDGTYTSEGKIIVVAAGKITEVKEVETPAEETPAEETKENAEEETPAEDPAKDEVETLKARIAELEAENEELKAKIKEYEEKTPAAPSIEEEEKKEKKFKKETSEEKKEMSFREKLLDYAFKSQN
jgi:flagellar biosynthesis GTPase FlhF